MKKIHQQTDAITEVMREVLETAEQSVLTKVAETLYEGDIENPQEWKKYQFKSTRKLKKSLLADSKRIRLLLRNTVIKSAQLGDFNPNKLIERIDNKTATLVQNALLLHRSRVRKVLRLEKTRPLSRAIFNQTQQGIQEGMSVATKDGRKIGYKEYMEMNVRTTVQSEISERQIELGRETGVVFYIVNSFADCADDHKEYQGRIYYDDRYNSFPIKDDIKKKISKFIRNKNLLSIQEVRNGDPFLTTRPNCRHTFNALSIDQALDITPDKLLNDLKLKTGSYRPKNYKATQEQRRNERAIRHYKARKEYNERLYNKKKTPELKSQIQKDQALITKWQAKQRDLVKSNPVLERDYRRETRKVLVNDLGARYNVKT